MSEELAGSHWLRRASIDGGWTVFCRLCGKSSRRTFMASMTNYAEAERSSRAYAHEHIATGVHQTALRAYQSGDIDEAFEGERLLNEIFGIKPLSEAELRRQSARRAASKVERQATRLRDQERQRAAPKCAVCGLSVSMKPEREGDRRGLPSGALVHVKCVS